MRHQNDLLAICCRGVNPKSGSKDIENAMCTQESARSWHFSVIVKAWRNGFRMQKPGAAVSQLMQTAYGIPGMLW